MTEEQVKQNEVEEVGTDEEVEEEVSLSDALSAAYDTDTAEESVAEADSQEEEEEVVPPEHWSREDQEAFRKMDKSGRDWALRLESNFTKGIEEKSRELKRFRDVIEPHKSLFPADVDETTIVQRLLNAQAFLQQNPVEGIKWLMKSYGVDEKQFRSTDGAVKQEEDDPYADPQVKALKEQVRQLTESQNAEARKAEMERQNALTAQIVQFKNAENDDGSLKHPHFDQVKSVMAGLIQSGRADTLEKAYDQAVWAVPEYRDSVVEQKAKEKAEESLREKAKIAEEAKKKARAVNGRSSAKTPEKPKTMTQALEEAYEKSIRGEL